MGLQIRLRGRDNSNNNSNNSINSCNNCNSSTKKSGIFRTKYIVILIIGIIIYLYPYKTINFITNSLQSIIMLFI